VRTFVDMSVESLPRWARELLESERVARLGYADERGHPRVLPVTFALAGGDAWSAIDEKPKRTREPARLRALHLRPEATLLVDVYDDDWSRLAWVQLVGRVEVVPVESSPEAAAALAARYPQYAERTPPGPLLRLIVARTVQWRAAGSPRPDHSLQDPG
jgi:PPOX class probable F420-dependent enzyme